MAAIAAISAALRSLASDAVDWPPRAAAAERRRHGHAQAPAASPVPGALNPDVSSLLSTHVPDSRVAASAGDSFCALAPAVTPADASAAPTRPPRLVVRLSRLTVILL